MADAPPSSPTPVQDVLVRAVEVVGEGAQNQVKKTRGLVEFIGGLGYLLGDTATWLFRAGVKREVPLGGRNVLAQMVRVGIRSIPIVALVQLFIGMILALQMAPTMEKYGQIQQIATIVAIAMARELGPLISGIVLSGFAGASIAAELGTMVEGEEIKALRASALNPIRFLVLPRVIATVLMLTMLTVIADIVGVAGGMLVGTQILDIDAGVYLTTTQVAILPRDFLSGIIKGPLFGLLIAIIACYEGLNVSGGAEGVGRATTNTVVKCIVALITADVIATSLLYAFGL
ncbi:MAG TPA: ABC transporter permease [Phycisphaerae bacterium]|nr:ABC transporter permease [Phycisphaerae bacterium]